MKTTLLSLLLVATVAIEAQTTHNLDWFTGIGNSVDLTIETGDTVIWTWTNPNHTVESIPGQSVETFDSGFLGPTGSTFSYTFTVEGDNDYFCGVHGPASMSGTITVQDNLSVDEQAIASFKLIYSERNQLTVKLPTNFTNGELVVHNILGKRILDRQYIEESSLILDTSSLDQGIYLLTITSENKSETQRFIKN